MGLILITFWLLSYFPKCDISQRLDNVRAQHITGMKGGNLSWISESNFSLYSVAQIRDIVCVCPYSPHEALAIQFPGGCMSAWAQGEWVEDSLGRHLFLQYPSRFYSGPWKGRFIHLSIAIRDKGQDYAIANSYQIGSTGWAKTGQISSISKDPRRS